jgi:hypothetical protein
MLMTVGCAVVAVSLGNQWQPFIDALTFTINNDVYGLIIFFGVLYAQTVR